MSAGPSGWAIKANFPALNSGRVFRLDWFDLFANFIVYMLIVVALFTKVIPQVCTRTDHQQLLYMYADKVGGDFGTGAEDSLKLW